jgi:hypothetical protein
VVREAGVHDPDVIEELELPGGVKAQVADELADVGPVLLLDVGPVVLVPRTRAGEGDLLRDAVVVKMRVDELRAVEFLSDVKRWSASGP